MCAKGEQDAEKERAHVWQIKPIVKGDLRGGDR
jgi:hypothetical protein